MEVIVETRNDCCEKVKVECSPVEWLVMYGAMLRQYRRKDVNKLDKKVLEKILNTDPIIKEISDD